MAQSVAVDLPDPAATARLGEGVGRALLTSAPAALTVFLEGELGAGKTTLVRGLLQALGHEGRVPSPTYTLIEPYALSGFALYHLDLYRIRSPGELADLGLAELAGERNILLVEWPANGGTELPPPDLRLSLVVALPGRSFVARAMTAAGRRLLDALEF